MRILTINQHTDNLTIKNEINMKLKKLTVNSFKKISPDSPVVIDFTESKFVKLVGDNTTGKTSLLESLLVACGSLSKDNKDFVNLQSNKIDIDLEFVGNDRKNYHVRVTKSKFTLEYEGEALSEPITKMKELLGVPGVSPMEIKFSPLKDIVKWLASYTTRGADEFEKQMLKLKEGIKKAKNSRADANRELKGLRQFLDNEPLYNNWEKSEKQFTKKVSISDLSAKLDEAGKRSDSLIRAESKLKQLKEREESIQAQIAALQSELQDVVKSVETGEKYIAANKSAKAEYDQIKAQYDTAAQESINYEKWQEIKRKKAEMDEYETLAQKFDAKEKELLEEVKELQSEIIPDVKGVELLLDDEMENGKVIRPEGLYRKGINSAKMSESEWWSLCMEIWRKNKVQILVIDNLSSLGSMAVEMIEKLIKDGAFVFAAEMDRTKKSIEIEYL